MKKIILLFSLFFSMTLLAQDNEVTYKHRAGINAGFTTGLGFTYAYWPGKLGAQISFLPISERNAKFYSVALTPYYTLSEIKYFKTFLFLGNHLVTDTKTTEYNIGFGPGFEVGNRVVFALRGGLGFFDVTNSFDILPTIEMGLFFKF